MRVHHYIHFDDKQLQRLEDKLDLLSNQVAERPTRKELRAMSKATQEAIDELKAEVAPLTDGVTAVSATVDRLLAMVEEAGDDPAEIRAVIANIRAEREKIVAAALKGTPIDPSTNV